MDVKIRDGLGVPIVITETTVHKSKKVSKKRSFVGIRNGLSNLINNIGLWALDVIEDSFFNESIEVIDEGVREEKHYAIILGHDGYESVLQAVEVEYKPPCIHHYEIIRHAEDEKIKVESIGEKVDPEKDEIAHSMRPDNNEVLGRIKQSLIDLNEDFS